MRLYLFLSALFWLIRQFAIPNPFDVLGEGLTVTIGEVSLLLSPELLNWMADPIIATFTFGIVGLYYIKRSNPAWGSILYMFFYAAHIALIYWVIPLFPAVWLMVLIGIAYVGLHITVVILRHRFD